MIETFDVIVIGVGSMGAPACYYLSKQGYKVLGIEQFAITHEFGSHAGQSRIIRKAYFEHSDYVPLLQRAYVNWKELENETGRQVYFKTGLLYAGVPHHEIIRGVKQSASLYNIELETVTDAEKIFPEFTFPENFEVLFEPEAGFVTPEQAIRLYAEQATKHGAAIHTNEKVLEWKKVGDGIEVITDKKIYRCGKLVITAGAWAGKMIPGLADKIKVTRQFVAWMNSTDEDNYALTHFPCWLIADDVKPGCFYGFPVLPEEKFGRPHGLKLAHHFPASATDPDNVNRQMSDKDFLNLEYCLQKYLPGVKGKMTDYKICLYANSPDEHFIIDKLPGFEEHVCIACGFSGHGFKFASVVGEILADIITTGKTSNPIGFLNAKRFI